MRRMLGAATRLSLASATFAGERLCSALAPTSRLAGLSWVDGQRSFSGALDSVAEAAAAELGEVAEVLHHAGLELSREGLGSAAGVLRGDTRERSQVVRRIRDILNLARADHDGQSARLEAQGKWQVFWQVRRAREAHGMARDGRPFDLEPALMRALAFDPTFSFWALEGLGHDYVKGHLQAALNPPRRLLCHPLLEGLDEGDLAALHAGLGLAVAEFILSALSASSRASRFQQAIERFEQLCCAQAVDSSHAEVALEALGLVVSVFYRPLFRGIENALRSERRLRPLFWHGVGRGAYFSGGQLLPGYGSLRRACEKVREQAAAEFQRPALAGLGYAFTMVNISEPSVVARLLTDALSRQDEDSAALGAADAEGLGTGVAGALAMQRLLGRAERAQELLEATYETMPIGLWRVLLDEPDRRLRAEGPKHDLYGSLPWGRAL